MLTLGTKKKKKINDFSFHIWKLEKEEQIKTKIIRNKEVENIKRRKQWNRKGTNNRENQWNQKQVLWKFQRSW